jgi:hypothetical protein
LNCKHYFDKEIVHQAVPRDLQGIAYKNDTHRAIKIGLNSGFYEFYVNKNSLHFPM